MKIPRAPKWAGTMGEGFNIAWYSACTVTPCACAGPWLLWQQEAVLGSLAGSKLSVLVLIKATGHNVVGL